MVALARNPRKQRKTETEDYHKFKASLGESKITSQDTKIQARCGVAHLQAQHLGSVHL